jgi:hypothetical protein
MIVADKTDKKKSQSPLANAWAISSKNSNARNGSKRTKKKRATSSLLAKASSKLAGTKIQKNLFDSSRIEDGGKKKSKAYWNNFFNNR